MAKFAKGHAKVGGCKKGTKQKFTTLKNAFLNVFEKLEEKPETSLYTWAVDNRLEFYQLVSKMLPKEMTIVGDEERPLAVRIIDARKS